MNVEHAVYGNTATENLPKRDSHGLGEITQALKWQRLVFSSQPCPLECFLIVLANLLFLAGQSLIFEISFIMLVCLPCPLFIDSVQEKKKSTQALFLSATCPKSLRSKLQSSTLMLGGGLSALSFRGRERMYTSFSLKNQQIKKKYFLSDQESGKKFCWSMKMYLEKARLYFEREKERRKMPNATQTCTS